eukprot:6471743-Amphidinium_carterae.1
MGVPGSVPVTDDEAEVLIDQRFLDTSKLDRHDATSSEEELLKPIGVLECKHPPPPGVSSLTWAHVIRKFFLAANTQVDCVDAALRETADGLQQVERHPRAEVLPHVCACVCATLRKARPVNYVPTFELPFVVFVLLTVAVLCVNAFAFAGLFER